MRQVALEGVGIYQGPSFLFGEDIQSGRLNEILADYSMNPYPIYIIYPAAEFIPLRVKAMINFLSKEFALNPWVAG